MNAVKNISTGITDDELKNYISKEDPLIVECGAHDGRDTERFLRLFPKCKVYAFEPDPRPIQRHDPPGFLDRVGSFDRVKLILSAVSDKHGEAVLHRSSGTPPNKSTDDWDHSSSLREPTGHLEWSPWCTFPNELQIVVPTTSLDYWLEDEEKIDCIDLLWVDVQGGQRELVAGAENALAITRYLYIECHKSPMYDGETTQEELSDILVHHCFSLVAVYEGYNMLFKSWSEYASPISS